MNFGEATGNEIAKAVAVCTGTDRLTAPGVQAGAGTPPGMFGMSSPTDLYIQAAMKDAEIARLKAQLAELERSKVAASMSDVVKYATWGALALAFGWLIWGQRRSK